MHTLGLFPSVISPPSSTSGGKSWKKAEGAERVLLYRNSTLPRRKVRVSAAAGGSSSSYITEYDLYELLGVESSSNHSQIKNAYRSLQKRCHPDIAGPAGHDMAIILNDAYSVLADPNSRSLYDQEQAKMAEMRGYTGRPLYSVWLGAESEERAVFVDEVKCVGCLKCALFAGNTFAVESVYGRARVVAQWADPEDSIVDAIHSCPVDCISIVERSNLAALEYLMSKQPRCSVRMAGGNTGGARVSNVFVDVHKFQRKFNEMKEKTTIKNSKGTEPQREARISAMQGIRSISNWWYWQSPKTTTTTSAGTCQKLVRIAPKAQKSPNTERLREAAARRRLGSKQGSAGHNSSKLHRNSDEYWTPLLVLPSPSESSDTQTPPAVSELKAGKKKINTKFEAAVVSDQVQLENPMDVRLPMVIGVVSAAVVGFVGGEQGGDGLREHVGGAMAVEVVNSMGMQVVLAGITWYLVGAAVVGLVRVLGDKRFWR